MRGKRISTRTTHRARDKGRLISRPPQVDEILAELRELTIERLRALDQHGGGVPAPTADVGGTAGVEQVVL